MTRLNKFVDICILWIAGSITAAVVVGIGYGLGSMGVGFIMGGIVMVIVLYLMLKTLLHKGDYKLND